MCLIGLNGQKYVRKYVSKNLQISPKLVTPLMDHINVKLIISIPTTYLPMNLLRNDANVNNILPTYLLTYLPTYLPTYLTNYLPTYLPTCDSTQRVKKTTFKVNQ